MGTSYVTFNNYNAMLRIPSFQGLYQDSGGMLHDPRFAEHCTNALTSDGTLRPFGKNTLLPQTLDKPIETLAVLYRRWYTADDEHTVFIAASWGNLYWCLPGDTEWKLIPLPADLETAVYQSNDWSWVSYEMNTEENPDAPIDVLLLSNAKDGMICVRGDNLTASTVQTPKRFGIIERHMERIWGTAIDDEPDMLVYSAPYDPFDWEQNDDYPEDGAGDIMQPTWDGDSFTALRTFGSYLIAFKKNSIWRVSGTNPSEYYFHEEYGNGTEFPNTIAVDVNKIYMLTWDGVNAYNGESCSSWGHEYAKEIFRRINTNAYKQPVGCMWKGAYYLALPLDGSSVNNAVLVYDTKEGTWLLREGVTVESFLSTPTKLYFTDSTKPGHVWLWNQDSWEGRAVPMRWEMCWNDFNAKHISKGSYCLYVTVECKESVTLKFSVQTEKKVKTKSITFTPPEEGKAAKQRKIMFGGNGRRFRIIIESEGEAPWRMLAGLMADIEIDYD